MSTSRGSCALLLRPCGVVRAPTESAGVFDIEGQRALQTIFSALCERADPVLRAFSITSGAGEVIVDSALIGADVLRSIRAAA